MNQREAFQKAVTALQTIYEAREALQIADLLLEHLSGMSKIERILQGQEELGAQQVQALETALGALLQHKPLQYVTGESWFYGLRLNVNEQVLIPRPETEELVDWIIKETRHGSSAKDASKIILDIGTGSGCIAISLKKHLPTFRVMALELSTAALETARHNAQLNKVVVEFLQMDVLDPAQTAILPAVDIIVSNPPYVACSEQSAMQENVLRFEPHLALFVPDEDALRFYRVIAELGLQKLRPGGQLYFEINESRSHAVVQLLQQKGFGSVVLKKDLFGKDRMVKAKA